MSELEVTEATTSPRTRPAPAKPSDLLAERSAALRRVSRDIPEIAALQKHAERHGSEQVVETAAELGYGFDTLVRLTEFCDRADTAIAKKEHRFSSGVKRSPAEDRVRTLLGIEKEKDGIGSED